MTVDFAQPQFTQGVILAIAADKSSLDFEVDAGYPDYLDNDKYFAATSNFFIFDAKTLQIKVGSDPSINTNIPVQRLSDSTFRYKMPAGISNAGVGDLLVLPGKASYATVVALSSGVKFVDYTVFSGANFEIAGNGGHIYQNYQNRPGPIPSGGGRLRLLSSAGDAFSSKAVRNGPQIIDSHFEASGDDAISVLGHYYMVVAQSGKTATIAAESALQSTDLIAGDLLRFMDQSGKLLGEAHITAVGSQLANYAPTVTPVANYFTGQVFYEITLDNAAPAAVSSMMWNTNANGKGFTISGTTVRNNRGRGLLIKADQGMITGNTFDGSSMYAVLIDAEFSSYQASSYTQDMLVQGNTITNVGRSSSASAQPYYAISLSGMAGQAHQRTQFINNTFKDNYVIDLLVSAASSVTIKGNTFTGKSADQQAQIGSGFSKTPYIKLMNVDGVTLSGNNYASGQTTIGSSTGVTNVTGESVTPL